MGSIWDNPRGRPPLGSRTVAQCHKGREQMQQVFRRRGRSLDDLVGRSIAKYGATDWIAANCATPEILSAYSMTLSACVSRAGGISIRSAFAVFALTTNCVACSTARSAAFAPLRLGNNHGANTSQLLSVGSRCNDSCDW